MAKIAKKAPSKVPKKAAKRKIKPKGYKIRSPRTPEGEGMVLLEDIEMTHEDIRRIDEIALLARVTFDQVIAVMMAIHLVNEESARAEG